MGLRFYFGSSGAGKSYQLYNHIIDRAGKEPRRNFLIVVPDQFTMQTQKELVLLNPGGGIMNIDVVSFGRLSHRIFEEVGYDSRPVLDDTGKSLILRKIAARIQEELPVLGGSISRQGYIHEVKSALSEFMQYGIGLKEMEQLQEFAAKRGALSQKLKDLTKLYEEFLKDIDGRFITTEETLELLQRALPKSAIVADSVVVFDGFTGFTPIQNRVIQDLMGLCREVIVTVCIPGEENPFLMDTEEQLFHLSRKTVHDLCRLAEESQTAREQDVVLTGEAKRFAQNESLAHLEKCLFRYPIKPYEEKPQGIQMFEAAEPKEEVRQTAMKIRELIRTKGYQFRDIAVVTGDLSAYAEHVEEQFALFEIPCFLDRTRGILLNPFIEYIRSALSIVVRNFSYESVFHFLRSGLADFSMEEVDELENYVLAFGIRGKSRYQSVFTKKTKQMSEDADSFGRINALRERLMTVLSPLFFKKTTVGTYVEGLYDFLVNSKVQEKLGNFEAYFEERQEPSRAREYAQIYPLVMDLLNQVYELLADETMTLQEFADILDAGFGEIEVGTIPQNVDRIVVGDIERTRLKQIKALFFLGVNDGNIPKNTGKGGIISDIDREFLRESNLELAPSPRQQMYIQRLYLYLNMTKPSQNLCLSYAKINSEGKPLRPAYLIDLMKKLFPQLLIEHPQLRPQEEQIETPAEGLNLLAAKLRDYAEGYGQPEDEKLLFTLLSLYRDKEGYEDRCRALCEAAFYRYRHHPIARAAARALYGTILQNSVSRLETFAACEYEHFLQYGLWLKEREEFEFEAVDMGNVFHAVLEIFSEKLGEKGCTWFDFSKETGEELVAEALSAYAVEYGNTVLYATARNEYAIERMKRILCRTVRTLQKQLQQGSFEPSGFEMSFAVLEDLDAVNIALSEEEKMKLRGRIDRVDTSVDGERLYVKVIDYKSGNKQFDLVALYYGLQLQLVVYLNAAMDLQKKQHPEKEVVPAALLYYHVADPVVQAEERLSPEELNEKLLGELRMNGVVNSDETIIERLDSSAEGKSNIIPVERKKDGSLSARSSVLDTQELLTVSEYVNQKIRSLGRKILDGAVSVNPYKKGNASACTYCSYRSVCGFDERIEGFEARELEEYTKEELLEKIRQEVKGE